jgi:Lipoprotein LpqB beta-propeller domain
LGDSVVSLSWRTGDDIVVSRNDGEHPVSYINLDGVNSDGPSRNLTMPVTTVVANPSTVYVADQRGVMQLSGSGAEDDQAWADVRPFTLSGALPILPG